MAINFPNAPQDGDVHTEQNTTWVYKDPPGVWQVAASGVPIEIAEADAVAGWQVMGDILVQWGRSPDTNTSGVATVTLPQAFKNLDYVSGGTVAIGDGAAGADRTVNIGGKTTDTFELKVSVNAIPSNAVSCYWWAYGEAPDALKKPKTVQAVGGSELKEFHDPTFAQSWRIVGNTLECWGHRQTSGGELTFAKTFARAPTITVAALTPGTQTDHTVSLVTESATGFTPVGFVAGVQQSVGMRWHAIGEWDGVS